MKTVRVCSEWYRCLPLTGPDRLVFPALPSLEAVVWELVETATENAGSPPDLVPGQHLLTLAEQ